MPLSKTRLYKTWQGMKQRCTNAKEQNYNFYGGRGISVCKSWQKFAPFQKWALANGYTDELRIDRIDNNKGYCPSNCRFVTHSQNCRNRRSNRYITAWGETKIVTEWADDPRCKVSINTLYNRIANYGWEAERAISEPPVKFTWKLRKNLKKPYPT